MAKINIGLIGTALFALIGQAHAGDLAGTVLVASGDIVAVRGGKDVPLSRGSQVESGDLIRVGESSSMQIRFADESIVALRANSQFKIDEYRFSKKAESDRSLFSLVKGGMRTITGLIGKQNPASVEVRAATATIGIRGTHFTVVNCSNDCRNTDGSLAPNGTYGGVIDGRIVVSNTAGQSEFSKNQFFVVPTTASTPQPLLAPPAFLRDKLDGTARAAPSGSQAKTRDAQATSSATRGTATTEAGGSGAQTASSPVGGSYTPAEVPALQEISAGVYEMNMAYIESSSSRIREGTSTGGVLNWSQAESNGGQSKVRFVRDFPPEDDLLKAVAASGYPSLVDYYKRPFAYSGTFTTSASENERPITYNFTSEKSASVEMGSSAEAGNVSWGRYTESYVGISPSGPSFDQQFTKHWAVGESVIALPQHGVFTYSWIGGTTPTDQNRRLGTMVSRGEFAVNFNDLSIRTTQPISWNMGSTNYRIDVDSPLNSYFGYQSNPRTGYSNSYSSFEQLNNTTTCTGGGCTDAYSSINVQFFGRSGQGLGASISTTSTTSEGAQSMNSVQVYQRHSTPIQNTMATTVRNR